MQGRKLIAGFAISVGILMLLMWGFFYLAGQIPELESKPIEIGLHIAAESITAIALLIGGMMLWKESVEMPGAFAFFGFGMLAYTLIVSPGYYLAQGVMGAGVGFFALLIVDLICVVVLWKA